LPWVHLADLRVPVERPAGFVYVLSYPGDPWRLKVGYASDPRARAKNIGGTLAPQAPKIEALYFVADEPQRVERAAHRRLRECRCNGEWFRCGLADARDAIERAAALLGVALVEVETSQVLR